MPADPNMLNSFAAVIAERDDLCREVHRLRKFIGWLDKTAEESAGVIAASWLRAQIAQIFAHSIECGTPEEQGEDFTALADAAWHEWVDAKERGE